MGIKQILLGLVLVSTTSNVLVHRAIVDTLAAYAFTNNSRNSTDSDPNLTADAFTDGLGFTGDTTLISSAIAVSTNFTDGVDQPTTVAANDYFSFTFTPNNGLSANLDT